MSRRFLEIESLEAFDEHIKRTKRLSGWFLQSLDLTGRSEQLAKVDPQGAVFLGCTFDDDLDHQLVRRGALVFPKLVDVPFNPYRAGLYSADELYDHEKYTKTLDAKVYAWSRRAHPQHGNLAATLATSLHDHAITDALDEKHLASQKLVGIMGGHALKRNDPAYAEAAELARALTRKGKIVLTGGGPGAMEAANLGAWFAPFEDAELPAAIDLLAAVPSFKPEVDAWAKTAAEVRRRWPNGGESLGIPTWFYGHEPPNQFPTWIAKYFTNALREDTLLQRCRGGIIYLPGAAGTVQEIFQAATGNYYAADEGQIAPMVLVGRAHWESKLPAWQLLSALGAERAMGGKVHLADDFAEALSLLS